MRSFLLALALLLVSLVLPGCQSPLVGGAGGASATDADGRAMTMDPTIAYESTGGIGGATANRLSYGRNENGSQAAPAFTINLQAPEGATTAYPSLRVIAPVLVNIQSNSQRDPTLTPDQISKIADVTREAADALKKALDGAKADAVEEPTPTEEHAPAPADGQ